MKQGAPRVKTDEASGPAEGKNEEKRCAIVICQDCCHKFMRSTRLLDEPQPPVWDKFGDQPLRDKLGMTGLKKTTAPCSDVSAEPVEEKLCNPRMAFQVRCQWEGERSAINKQTVGAQCPSVIRW